MTRAGHLQRLRHDDAERWPRSRQDIAEITSETDEIRETDSDVAKLPTEVAIASSAAVFGRSKLATAGGSAAHIFCTFITPLQ